MYPHVCFYGLNMVWMSLIELCIDEHRNVSCKKSLYFVMCVQDIQW